MDKHVPIAVEARCADDVVVPLAVVEAGRRRAVTVVNRQWDRGWQRFFDVHLEGGEDMILRLERRSCQWYVAGRWGDAREA